LRLDEAHRRCGQPPENISGLCGVVVRRPQKQRKRLTAPALQTRASSRNTWHNSDADSLGCALCARSNIHDASAAESWSRLMTSPDDDASRAAVPCAAWRPVVGVFQKGAVCDELLAPSLTALRAGFHFLPPSASCCSPGDIPFFLPASWQPSACASTSSDARDPDQSARAFALVAARAYSNASRACGALAGVDARPRSGVADLGAYAFAAAWGAASLVLCRHCAALV
jgi:hypothetical protein